MTCDACMFHSLQAKQLCCQLLSCARTLHAHSYFCRDKCMRDKFNSISFNLISTSISNYFSPTFTHQTSHPKCRPNDQQSITVPTLRVVCCLVSKGEVQSIINSVTLTSHPISSQSTELNRHNQSNQRQLPLYSLVIAHHGSTQWRWCSSGEAASITCVLFMPCTLISLHF
jgi:hypothetical protein